MAKNQEEVWENPLVPHALMRRMYEAMKELRATGTTAAGRRAGETSRRGEEACRASSLLSLEAGDLVSDVQTSGAPAKGRGSARSDVFGRLAPGALRLPPAEDAMERLTLGIGAASALRAQGGRRLVLAYVEGDALTVKRWKQVLGAAGQAQAPIVFVLLPTKDAKRQGEVSDRAQGWGVPGMPVDAADAVALYRVMQESVLRARAGDGPALLECVTWALQDGSGKSTDGVRAMRAVLEQRGLLRRERAAGTPKRTRKSVD